MSTTILDDFLDPVAECLTPEVARRIADLKPRADLLQQLETLREKANEGQLSPQERADYEEFVESMDIVAILKAKARAALLQKDA